MPRININEKDRTAPGISSDYANFAVLITGFEGKEPTDKNSKEPHPISKRLPADLRPVQPDSNGVYEFVTASDFKETIGLSAPKRELDGGNAITYNYGNQMAYELLNLGYSILYKPIKSQEELTNSRTWEIFKDKVSYDFRFVSHGLLQSDGAFMMNEDNRVKLATKQKLISIIDSVLNKSSEDASNALCPNYASTLQVATCTHIAANANDEDIYSYISYSPAEDSKKEYFLESTIISAEDIKDIMNVAANSDESKTEAEVKESWWGLVETALEEAYLETLTQGDTSLELTDVLFKEYISQNLTEDNNLKSFEEYWNDLGFSIAKARSLVNEVVTTDTINEANKLIANLAAYKSAELSNGNADEPASDSGRGDCIALIELDENTYINTVSSKRPEMLICEAINKVSMTDATGPYCALTVPSVFYTSLENDGDSVWAGNNKMPGAFHYLACFIRSLGQGYAEWYAAAGYTRGVSNLVVDHTSVKLGEVAINTLEPRNSSGNGSPLFACNVIANFRGSYYLWGNRTAYPLGGADGDRGDLVASHFLNIRQLCTTIKKKLFVACRKFTFDPNSDTLWINFCNAIKPTLEIMKADQGIRDYRIVKVATDKKATLKAKIRIIPIEAVEDFILEVSLEDAFGETTAAIIG